jgi:signal transduction histidine kinase
MPDEQDRDPIGTLLPARRRRWVVGGIIAAAAAAFIADLFTDRLLAFGVAYVPLICTAAFHRDARAVWWVAALTTLMVLLGFFLPTLNPDVPASLVNRVLSLLAIGVTAMLVRYERYVRDRLIEQRRRALAAERTKTHLLSNLSHELRTPLNAILGFSDLLLADCRPDQLSALRQVSTSGKRLLRTLENLIELSRFDERVWQRQDVDVARALRQLTEATRPEAAEQQIVLTYAADPARQVANTDPAALRRILDNLLANAIKFTRPGGSIAVTLETGPTSLIATVRDSGIGMPQQVLDQLGAPFFQGDGGIARRFEGMGTGLALSLRLAAVMGATLTFESAPGQGTTAHLRLLTHDTTDIQASR